MARIMYVTVIVLISELFVASGADARSLVFPQRRSSPGIFSQPDRFAVGNAFAPRGPFPDTPLDQLIDRVAGVPRMKTLIRYGGNFEKYYHAVRTSREGKVFEALWADAESKAFVRAGSPWRSIATAAEGATSYPADVVYATLDGDGLVVRGRVQLKLGSKSAISALSDEKYAGMLIGTTQESLSVIQQDMLKVQQAALRRQIPLPEPWRTVEMALIDGRLLERMPSGQPLPTHRAVAAISKVTLHRQWDELMQLSMLENVREPRIAAVPGRWGRVVEAGGRVLFVVDFGIVGALTYHDVNRYRVADINANYLAFRTGLHGTQIVVAYYAVFSPDPLTKSVAAVTLVVLTATDMISDYVQQRLFESRSRAARLVLEHVDRDERFHVARAQLLNSAHEVVHLRHLSR